MCDDIEFNPDCPLDLEKEDFDFRPVEDREIVACCLWEYARESTSFKHAADLVWTQSVRRRQELGKEVVEQWELDRAARLERDLEEAGFDNGLFHEAFLATDYFGLKIYFYLTTYVGSDAEPWQKLPLRVRDHLIDTVDKSWTVRPFAPAFVFELELLWNAHSPPLLEARAQEDIFEREECELTVICEECAPLRIEEEHPGVISRKTVAALTIDFGRFSDAEIIEAFAQWIRKNRPVEWKKPLNIIPGAPRRGMKLLDYRVALERLALLRLLHWHSPADLDAQWPDVWETFRRDETHFRTEADKACSFFRRLFPFLPESELPFSSIAHEDWDLHYEDEWGHQ